MTYDRSQTGDPETARRLALFVSAGLLAGVGTLAAVAAFVVGSNGNGAATPLDQGWPIDARTLTSVVAACLCFASIIFARRMHAEAGDVATRSRRAFSAHLVSSVLAESAAMLGGAFVIAGHSWDLALPLALGGALLVMGLIRAIVVFGGMVKEAGRTP